MSKFSLAVQFVKPVFKADRSVSLIFETGELTGLEVGILSDARQHTGWLVFSTEDDITDLDIPKEKADSGVGGKTPAQRLRAVLYVRHQQLGVGQDFETWYRQQLEKIINKIKESLDE